VQALNLVDVFAFPLGYFLVAQGALLAFIGIGVLSARRQDRNEARRATDA
jgi:putative solute:sodium symporter small subunit